MGKVITKDIILVLFGRNMSRSDAYDQVFRKFSVGELIAVVTTIAFHVTAAKTLIYFAEVEVPDAMAGSASYLHGWALMFFVGIGSCLAMEYWQSLKGRCSIA